MLTAQAILEQLGVMGGAAAAPIGSQELVGVAEHDPVTPASVMKVQVAVAALDAMVRGRLDGSASRVLPAAPRTPGPVGLSLLRDEVRMSLRDLVVLMLTVSDNVATDAVIAATGLDAVNTVTARLGLARTRVASDLRTMLDEMAREVGSPDYAALAAHVPEGPAARAALLSRLDRTAALDPDRGSRSRRSTRPRSTPASAGSPGHSSRGCAPEGLAAVGDPAGPDGGDHGVG